MDLNIVCLTSPKQCLLRHFGKESYTKVMDWADLEREKPVAIFYREEALLQENMEAIESWKKHFPLISYPASMPEFSELKLDAAWGLIEAPLEKWTLTKNLALLENLFPTLDHLCALWPNRRTEFFEELWHLFKNNLAAQELCFIYNDLAQNKEKEEKKSRQKKGDIPVEMAESTEVKTEEIQLAEEAARPKLAKIAVTGHTVPSTAIANEAQEALLKHCEKEFGPNFHLSEYSTSKKEMLATMMIKGSPVLIMAKVAHLHRLQLALLKSLADGLTQKLI